MDESRLAAPPPPLYRLTHPPTNASTSRCFLLAFSGCIFGSSGGVSACRMGSFHLPPPASGFTVARYGNHKSWVFRHVSVHIYIRTYNIIHVCTRARVTRKRTEKKRDREGASGVKSKFLLFPLLFNFFHAFNPIPCTTAAVIYIKKKKDRNKIKVGIDTTKTAAVARSGIAAYCKV